MSWQRVFEDGFEGAFVDWAGIGELTVPEGWMPVWVEGDEPGVNHRPECDRERVRVVSGASAAKMFTVHASHDGALMRRVEVRAGELVRVVGMGATFSQRCGQGIRIGIDPSGGTDHRSPAICWSRWLSHYSDGWVGEQFVELSVMAVAEGDVVSVFLASRSDYAAPVVAAYWDDVRVEQEGDVLPEPGPGDEPSEGDLAEAVAELAGSVQALAGAVELLAAAAAGAR